LKRKKKLAQLEVKDFIQNTFINPMNTSRFLNYDGRFLYPPRIEQKVQPMSIDGFDNGEYVGQLKFNGSNTSVSISPDTAIAKERHNTFFKIPPMFDYRSLHRGSGFMAIAGEFMNKSKLDEKNRPFKGFCIWDIMAYDGKILIGSTIEERAALLEELYPSRGTLSVDGHVYLNNTDTPNVFRVQNYYGDFRKLYDIFTKVDMIEGFVLKRKNGKLEMMSREQNNIGWSVKVRKPTSNYLYARGGGIGVGAQIGVMRGEHKGEKGYIVDVSTEYKVKLSDGEEVILRDGDFYL
jgi:hypothetical protein